MRIAAIYDIHANLPALEAVVQDIRQAKADLIVVGGDVIPGPMPRQTLEYLLGFDIPLQFILGNGDEEVLAHMRGGETGKVPEHLQESVRWVVQQLVPEYEPLLAGWPLTFKIEVPGLGKVLFCHATPRNNTEVFTRLTPEQRLLPVFADCDADVVVCGHTHMQFDRMVGRTRVVNAGSVGMTYGEPGACWISLVPDVQLRHTRYPLTQAAERIRSSGYPLAQDFADHNVLLNPSAQEALEVFSKMELAG